MILNPKFDFLKEDYKNPNLTKVKSELDASKPTLKSLAPLLATVPLLLTPSVAFAADTNATFDNVFGAVMTIFDYGVVLVIVFAGASWALGHRSKAIELLIGVACGYLLARKAVDIRDFLKSI